MSRGLQGLRAWVLQRLSALYLGVFFLFCVVYVLFHPGMSYAQWHAWLSQPYMLMALGLFYVTLILHAWIGLRDVALDYLHPLWLRLSVLFLIGLFLAACALWAGRVLIMAAA